MDFSPALTETAVKGTLIENLLYPANYANPFTSLAYFHCISCSQSPHEVDMIINFFSHKGKGSLRGKDTALANMESKSNPGLPEHHHAIMPLL